MRVLSAYNHLPFAERPGEIRVETMQVIDLLEGDLVKYTTQGGAIVAMPNDEAKQWAVRTMLVQVGLHTTNRHMDVDAYDLAADWYRKQYAHLEEFEWKGGENGLEGND